MRSSSGPGVELRSAELGADADREAVRHEMAARDARDQGRGVAPLVAAEDAHVIDTSELDAEAAFKAALAVIGTRE